MFATGFFVLAEGYEGEPHRSRIISELEKLGFEVYDPGTPKFLVFYVEAPDVKSLEDKVKAGESVEGVAKAYIVYGFLGDDELRWRINEALEKGELELDESTIRFIDWIISRLSGKSES